ncbi:MAG: 16S rRNA (adenine(1518)-N(6)/adenine(1519)-N(6))-dimethyltransferase RsmA [Pseudomonadota bacterium]
MVSIDPLPPLRDVIEAHDLRAKKSLGQNFLLDLNLTAKIARQAGDLREANVLEIGPGPGGLTRGLLASGASHVTAIERDERCLGALSEISEAYPGQLNVISEDALRLDAVCLDPRPTHIVSNLPYNIGTELLIRWMSPDIWPPPWQRLVLMFQKEVADRIVAVPGTKAYGRLSVFCQWRSDARIVMTLPPQAFTPPPKIHSAVVRIDILDRPKYDANVVRLSHITAAAFGQRRKMLRSSLKRVASGVEHALEATGIDPTRRGETLTVEEFCRLSLAL